MEKDITKMGMSKLQFEISVQDKINKYSINSIEQFEKEWSALGIVKKHRFQSEKIDPATEELLKTSLDKLNEINARTFVKSQKVQKVVEDVEKNLKEGEESRILNLDYINTKGEPVHHRFGIKKVNGQLKYFSFTKEMEEQVNKGSTFEFAGNAINRSDLMTGVARCTRHKVKSEMGIGESIYEIKDNDGNMLMVTDPRDEIVGKGEKAPRSFQDGFKCLNIYKISPTDGKELIGKEGLINIINANGVKVEDIRKHKTLRLGTMMQMYRTYNMAKGSLDRGIQQGMDLTTSTRS